MTDPPRNSPGKPDEGSFFHELKKRRVYRAAAAYAVVAWGVTEIVDGVVSRMGWSDWIATLVVILFVVGFPVAMFLAWVFDWTKSGLRRAEPWTARGWLSISLAAVFLVGGSGTLFWLINPSGVVRTERTGVAVLPCRYRGDPDLAFRGEGLARMVSEDLAYSRQLWVPDFDSVAEIASWNLPTRELADTLGVTWLVECRVIQDGETLAMDATIVHAPSDESARVTENEAPALDMLEVVKGVSMALEGKLGIGRSGNGAARGLAQYPPVARAVDEYLKGEAARRIGTAQGLREALVHFRNAQIADGFALARAREADTLMALLDADPPETASAVTASTRAVDLILSGLGRTAADLPEWYASKLRFAALADRLGAASPAGPDERREWFEKAIELKPSYADAYRLYAGYLASIGRAAEAAGYSDTARRLAPTAGSHR